MSERRRPPAAALDRNGRRPVLVVKEAQRVSLREPARDVVDEQR